MFPYWGWLAMYCGRPGDYHSLCLTCTQFHPIKVTQLTNLAKVTLHGLGNWNSNAWGWHNGHQSKVISITSQLILQNGKTAPRCKEGKITGSKHCPSALLTMSTSLLQQPTTITCCEWFYRNCVNIDSTVHGRVGRVTDCTVRGLRFKSLGPILTSRTETSSLSRVVRDGWDLCSIPLNWWKKKVPGVESSTWSLNSHNCSENNTKAKELSRSRPVPTELSL